MDTLFELSGGAGHYQQSRFWSIAIIYGTAIIVSYALTFLTVWPNYECRYVHDVIGDEKNSTSIADHYTYSHWFPCDHDLACSETDNSGTTTEAADSKSPNSQSHLEYRILPQDSVRNFITEYSLECGSPEQIGLFGSSFFFGYMAGSFLILPQADQLGRFTVVWRAQWGSFIVLLLLSGGRTVTDGIVNGIESIFQNYQYFPIYSKQNHTLPGQGAPGLSLIYLFLFLYGLLTPGFHLVSFVHIQELVPTRYASGYAATAFICETICGQFLLELWFFLAFNIQSIIGKFSDSVSDSESDLLYSKWSYEYFFLTLAFLRLFPNLYFYRKYLRESPRWLLKTERYRQAGLVFTEMSVGNRILSRRAGDRLVQEARLVKFTRDYGLHSGDGGGGKAQDEDHDGQQTESHESVNGDDLAFKNKTQNYQYTGQYQSQSILSQSFDQQYPKNPSTTSVASRDTFDNGQAALAIDFLTNFKDSSASNGSHFFDNLNHDTGGSGVKDFETDEDVTPESSDKKYLNSELQQYNRRDQQQNINLDVNTVGQGGISRGQYGNCVSSPIVLQQNQYGGPLTSESDFDATQTNNDILAESKREERGRNRRILISALRGLLRGENPVEIIGDVRYTSQTNSSSRPGSVRSSMKKSYTGSPRNSEFSVIINNQQLLTGTDYQRQTIDHSYFVNQRDRKRSIDVVDLQHLRSPQRAIAIGKRSKQQSDISQCHQWVDLNNQQQLGGLLVPATSQLNQNLIISKTVTEPSAINARSSRKNQYQGKTNQNVSQKRLSQQTSTQSYNRPIIGPRSPGSQQQYSRRLSVSPRRLPLGTVWTPYSATNNINNINQNRYRTNSLIAGPVTGTQLVSSSVDLVSELRSLGRFLFKTIGRRIGLVEPKNARGQSQSRSGSKDSKTSEVNDSEVYVPPEIEKQHSGPLQNQKTIESLESDIVKPSSIRQQTPIGAQTVTMDVDSRDNSLNSQRFSQDSNFTDVSQDTKDSQTYIGNVQNQDLKQSLLPPPPLPVSDSTYSTQKVAKISDQVDLNQLQESDYDDEDGVRHIDSEFIPIYSPPEDSIFRLLYDRVLVQQLVCCSLIWLGMNVVYWGCLFASKSLVSGIFQGYFVNALSNLMANLSVGYLANKLGRKWLSVGLSMMTFIFLELYHVMFEVQHGQHQVSKSNASDSDGVNQSLHHKLVDTIQTVLVEPLRDVCFNVRGSDSGYLTEYGLDWYDFSCSNNYYRNRDQMNDDLSHIHQSFITNSLNLNLQTLSQTNPSSASSSQSLSTSSESESKSVSDSMSSSPTLFFPLLNLLADFFIFIACYCCSLCFAVLFFYTTQLFPIKLRGKAFAVCSFLGRCGAIFAPLLVSKEARPMGTVGKVSLGVSIVYLVGLGETGGEGVD